MKLLNIFALIATTMVVSTEAIKVESQIKAPQQEESIALELAEVNTSQSLRAKLEEQKASELAAAE